MQHVEERLVGEGRCRRRGVSELGDVEEKGKYDAQLETANRLLLASSVARASMCKRATSRTSTYEPEAAVASSSFFSPLR